MVNRMFTILTAFLIFLAVPVLAQDPGTPDTLRIDSIKIDPGDPAVVDVTFFNDQELTSIQMPFSWTSPDITLDSISYLGSRVDYISTKLATYNNPEQKVLTAVIIFFEDPIPAGDGLYCKMHFDVPSGTPDQKIYIDTLSYTEADNPLFFVDASTIYVPVIDPGIIVVGDPVDPPVFEVAQSSFYFEAMAGEPTPDPQVLNIQNVGSGTLNWSADWDASWLDILPAFGSVLPGPGQNVQLAINTTSLAPGLYEDTVTLTDANATNSPVDVVVQYNVIEPPPTITLSPEQFIFNAVAGGSNPPDQFLDISNTGFGVLEWTATNDSSWLILNPTSGTGPATVTLSVDITGLPFGVYYDTITVSDPAADNDPQYAEVRLEVASDLPIIEVDTSFFFINVVDPINTPGRTFTITNAGGGSMNFNLTENSSKIVGLNPSSGTVPQQVEVTFKTTNGSPGDEIEDTVWINSSEAINSPQPVVFHFLYTSEPDEFVVNVTSLSEEYYECGQGMGNKDEMQQFLSITNGNGEPLDFDLIWEADWFDPGTTSATTSAFLEPSFEYCGMAPGVYYDTLILYAPSAINHPFRIPLTLTINATDQTPQIYVSNDSLRYIARVNQGSKSTTLTINNQFPGCMDWELIENTSWLDTSIDSSECKKYPWYLVTTADATGLPIGRYVDTMSVSSTSASNSPLDIDLVLDVWELQGDANWDGTINILDILWMIEYEFFTGPAPLPFEFIGDVNCDYAINILDIIVMIDYEFNNGDPYCGNVSK